MDLNQIRRCKTCVETNSRPTTQFDQLGICIACRNVSKNASAKIDWQGRRAFFEGIVKKAKENKVGLYDCIIGVSGGKDSTRQALVAREFGLQPLLVSCQYPPEHQTVIGVHNLSNLVELGFDVHTVTPAPINAKKMMLYCLEKFGNMFNAAELTLYASLPIVATAYNIPLILLGENPSLAWGTNVDSLDYDGNRMRNMNTLRGGDPRQFAPENIEDSDLFFYRFPRDRDIQRAGINIVYLGYFVEDFNDFMNTKIATENGLKVRTGEGALPQNLGGLSPATSLDDDFDAVNQMLKYLKFGFGKTTQDAGSLVRHGHMTREEALRLIQLYDGKCGAMYLQKVLSYLQLSPDQFWQIVDKWVNKNLFERESVGVYRLKNEII